MKLTKTYQQLRTQVGELRRTHNLSDDSKAFAYWFCQSLLANPDDHVQIKQALVDGKDDRNVDLLFVSDAAKTVFICQTKYRQALMKKNELGNDVRAHADIARAFAAPEADFESSISKVKVDGRARLRDTWRLVRKHDYSLRLVYATTGKASVDLQAQAESIVESVRFPDGKKPDFSYLFYDGKACCRLFVDYQDLVPSIPYVELRGIPSRFRVEAENDQLHSYVFPLSLVELRRLYAVHKERLFARNIRLWKGETATNDQIQETLKKRQDEFFYLNNGITILATDVRVVSDDCLRVFSPQIINGQQTTRTAAAGTHLSKQANVLVKVLWKDAHTDAGIIELRDFVRRVVRATNFQNKVSLSELAANDPEHIALDRAFRAKHWRYSRKKGRLDFDAGDMPSWMGEDKPFHTVTLQDLTTALVACRLDPQLIRTEGVESLFEEENRQQYKEVFNDKRTVDECMVAVLCYELANKKITKPKSLDRTIENYGVYYIAHCIHRLVERFFASSPQELLDAMGARKKAISYDDRIKRIRKVVGLVWKQFVVKNKGDEQEMSSFISEYASKQRWIKYWNAKTNKSYRAAANAAVAKLLRVRA